MQQGKTVVMKERQKLAELLRNCSKNLILDVGKQVHGAVLRMGYAFDLMINNDLIDMYGKCSRIKLARSVFDKMFERNVVSWTALMCGYLQRGNAHESFLLLSRMVSANVRPNEFTLSTNLKACGSIGALENGRQIHGLCGKSGFEKYPVVGNSIIDMYSRCGKIGEAENMFHEMPERSLITWNVMIAGYATGGFGDKSLFLFKQMQEQGEIPDEFTFASTLKACSGFKAVREGSQIHGFLITRGFLVSSQKVIAGALIDLYVKSGNLFEAQKLFSQLEQKSVISWTTLMVGNAQEGKLPEAMDLFKQLRESSIEYDGFVLSSMMGIFADFALVELGKQLHCCAVKVPAGLDISVLNSVIDMYLKCGLIEEAEALFDGTPHKNVISWTVMITGYGKYGLGLEAVGLFKKMHMDNVEPDEVSYLALLTACSHSGLVQESEEYFSKLCNSNRLKPSVEHYACMVDILGRAGRLKEAKVVIENMPLKPNVGIWQTLLSACRVHKNVEIGREVGEILLKLDGNNPVNYVLMSNIFADARRWEECEGLRGLVKAKGLKKEAGQSWVEIDKKMHFFYNRDETHPLTKAIHEFLYKMEKKMKDEIGYTREVSFSLHDVEEETKDESLRFHSEKLAIGLALLSGGDEIEGKPIRVFKNLRVCGDCHEYIKGLSKIFKKILLVRDANRFHKFENGACSCRDYW
ncbi:PREDICTED: putative pentatricopeptide repeat-containing protein At3g15130 [Nicotiana attenuata]|uniref:Pentatricopeptide repeat-containing protein n=1 Tax=Nicotiana attenuata TaxID=49451 RepID=A0A1J6KE02_NICAT|nr:PREDICTED: putative pentatricopeptide repeat-containing protein At3g15130 [Nicotiana attenuata]OIT27614.1 putative pentatricopeptide repeat-containing protein [Nicotiana attenuata]